MTREEVRHTSTMFRDNIVYNNLGVAIAYDITATNSATGDMITDSHFTIVYQGAAQQAAVLEIGNRSGTYIDETAEVFAGDILVVRSGLTQVGTKSITIFYEMANLDKNEIAATLECVCVLIDLQARKSIELSENRRDMASKHLIKTAKKEQ